MSKKLLILIWIGFGGFSLQAQTVNKPKVVIGIVIDQMRADYLNVFNKHYGNKGFNLLKNKGAWFTNCYINYLPAYTGPGHACIYTGSVPSIHGIVGNNWYDKKNASNMYCVADAKENAIGGSEIAGHISPRNLKVTTIADELRLSTNHRSRTFAISLKDRGAVLPGGHTSNASYWMDDEKGYFMTSTFYMNQLPEWVNRFNNKGLARKYLNLGWNTLSDKSKYLYAQQDENDFEGKFGDQARTSSPYNFKSMGNKYIKKTPYGNSILFDFAKQAILNEKIGQQNETDFLALSFSATDYIGHVFGPNSLEVEDTYARFDKDLASFIDFLNAQYGKDNYLLFLTADHGAANNPNYLKSKKIPAGYFFDQKEQLALNEHLEKKFGKKDLCVRLMNCQVYLNHALIDNKKQGDEIIEEIVSYYNAHDLIQMAFKSNRVNDVVMPSFLMQYYSNSYFIKRSGDVTLLFSPSVLDAYSYTGTSHGAWSAYDTHIPLLFYGRGVFSGMKSKKVFMTDIAPTIANMLGITPPNGSIGNVIIK